MKSYIPRHPVFVECVFYTSHHYKLRYSKQDSSLPLHIVYKVQKAWEEEGQSGPRNKGAALIPWQSDGPPCFHVAYLPEGNKAMLIMASGVRVPGSYLKVNNTDCAIV